MSKTIEMTNELVNILKNAGNISRNIMIKENDNHIRVKSADRTLMMSAEVEKFPNNFFIYDILDFLSVASLVSDPVIDLNDEKFIKITDKESNTVINYQQADQRMVESSYVSKDLVPDEVLTEFDITQQSINATSKAAATMRLPNIAFVADGNKVTVDAIDVKLEHGTKGNTFSTKITDTGKTFKLIFESDHFKLIGGDYLVQIAKKNNMLIAIFTNKSRPVKYVIAVSSESVYG
jgi:hypothetical protein